MAQQTTPETYTIDAAGQSIGRVATEAAKALRGKHRPDFAPHVAPNVRVEIKHCGEVSIHYRKLRDEVHVSYSGYPGGKKETPIAKTANEKGRSELMRRAVYGMLPPNRLRDRLMKNLTVHE